MKTKTIFRLISIIVILSFFINFNLAFLVQSALAGEKRPPKSKSKRSSAKKKVLSDPVVSEETLLDLVKQYIGTPYRPGGASKTGMDCSGFVKRVYSMTFSVDLPHSSSQQHALPIMKKVDSEELKAGDLVFFSQKNKRINHVGIYLADGNFIHASRRTGVTISSLDDEYWKLRMVCAKRPTGLSTSVGTDDRHSVRGVDIAWDGTGGTLKSTRNERSFSSIGEEMRLPSWWDFSFANGLPNGPSHVFELQISRGFSEDSSSMKLSLLRENFHRYSSAEADILQTSRSPSPLSERQYTLGGYRQGVKMASDINPLEWLRITPSLSYLGYEHEMENASYWGPSLGLAVQIRPSPTKWSFLADIQYWDESDRVFDGFNNIDRWKNRNLSLMLGYDLSNDMRLRIVGQRGFGDLFGVKDRTSDEQREHSGLFFTFDWAF